MFLSFNHFLEARAEISQVCCWVFGRIEDTKIPFRDLLTFKTPANQKNETTATLLATDASTIEIQEDAIETTEV